MSVKNKSESNNLCLTELEKFFLYLYNRGLILDSGFIPKTTFYEEYSKQPKIQNLLLVSYDDLELVIESERLARSEIGSVNFKVNMSRIRKLLEMSNGKVLMDIDNFDKMKICKDEIEHMDEEITLAAKLEHVISIKREICHYFQPLSKSCPYCRVNFTNEFDICKHFDEHGPEFVINWDEAEKSAINFFQITFNYCKKFKETKFYVQNVSHRVLYLKGFFVYHSSSQLIPVIKRTIEFKIDQIEEIFISTSLFGIKNYKYSFILLADDSNHCSEFLDQFHFAVSEPHVFEISTMTGPSRSYRPMNLLRLESFPSPKEIRKLVRNNFKLDRPTTKERELCEFIKTLSKSGDKTRLNSQNYVDALQVMSYIHDYNIQYEMESYNSDSSKLLPGQSEGFYKIPIKDFTKSPVHLLDGDFVNISVIDEGGIWGKEISGTVVHVYPDYILVELDEVINVNFKCKVRMAPNRLVIQMELNALQLIKRLEISDYFFPHEVPVQGPKSNFEYKWFDKKIASNPEQMVAVKNIVQGTAFPAPYILFGPPGTGKTSTIVEAIAQIWKLKPNSYMLVTAQSNAACNEIANRLLKIEEIPEYDIFRFFPKSFEKMISDMDKTLMERSNLSSGRHRIPSYDEIKEPRIIICTLTNSGRLVQARIELGHFDYVFIDECGSASEPNALVAIVGLITIYKEVIGHIILSGDPKQLGPVIRSNFATKLGLGVSLMERLMNLDIYKRNPITNEYNSLLITKLLQNYRSNSDILKFSNEKFYDGELQTMASVYITHFALNWTFLPNKNFPIIFHACEGCSEKEENSTSMFNPVEVKVVRSYVDRILSSGINGKTVLQSDIGVISPYQLQVQKLRQMCCQKGWNEIEVGSVEQYQGREKPVIILSTVRSFTPTVGFLNNVKRLNVAITRAKSLLIIIGNPKTLQMDKTWFEFLKFIRDNKGQCGVPFDLNEKNIVDEQTKMEAFNKYWNILV